MSFQESFDDLEKKYEESAGEDFFNPTQIIFANEQCHKYFVHKLAEKMTVVGAKYESLENFAFKKIIEIDNARYNGFKIVNRNYFRDVLIKILSSKSRKELEKLDMDVSEYLFPRTQDSKETVTGEKNDGNRLFQFSKILTHIFSRYEEDLVWDIANAENFPEDTNLDKSDKKTLDWEYKLYTEAIKMLEAKKMTTLYNVFRNADKGCLDSINVLLFGFDSRIVKPNSLKHRIYNMFPDNKKIEVVQFSDVKDKTCDKIVLSRAISRLREVENVHRQVCDLLSSGCARLDDIVVYAPNINDYFTPIMQVFGCYERGEYNINGKYEASDIYGNRYPVIPFDIFVPAVEFSQISSGMEILKNVADKGYVGRSDIVGMLENKAVQDSMNLSEDDVDNIKRWIDGMRVYRDRSFTGDSGRIDEMEWEKTEWMLAISMLTDAHNFIDGSLVLDTYADMHSTDKDLLSRYFTIVDNLENFCKLAKKCNNGNDFEEKRLDKNEIEEIREIIVSLFKIYSDGEELDQEQKVLFGILHEINVVEDLFFDRTENDNTGKDGIPFDVFMDMILDSVQNIVIHIRTFGTGLSFMNFNENAIVAKKYIFLMGMGMDNYPVKKVVSTIDIASRRFSEREMTDSDLLDLAFEYAQEKLYVSYNYFDLQKEAELYISPLVQQLIKEYGLNGLDYSKSDRKEYFVNDNAIQVKLDDVILPENCENKERKARIWNSRTFRNHVLYNKNGLENNQPGKEKSEDSDREKTIGIEKDVVQVIKINKIIKYLKDPFVYYVEDRIESDREDFDKTDFEPIELDNFSRKDLIKKAYDLIKDPSIPDINDKKDHIRKDVDEKIRLGDKEIADEIYDVANILYEREKELREKLNIKYKFDFSGTKYVSDNFFDMEFDIGSDINGNKPKLDSEEKIKVKIEGDLPTYAFNGSQLFVYRLEEKEGDCNALLGLYIASLILICQLGEDEDIQVMIGVISAQEKGEFIKMKKDGTCYERSPKKKKFYVREYKLKKNEAEEILKKICRKMIYSEKKEYHRCCRPDLLDCYDDKIEIKNINDLKNKLIIGKWKYFGAKNFINIETDIGYSADNEKFADEWKNEIENCRKMIKFLKRGKSNEQDAG